MLRPERTPDKLEVVPVAYMVYGPDGVLLSHNDRLLTLFPPFAGKTLVGLTRPEVRQLLKDSLTNKEAIDQLEAVTRAQQRWSAAMGVFELADGNFYALDDLALPGGGTLTLVRDMTEKKRHVDSVTRLEAALSRLAREEAIYNGAKADAYRILSEIACKALGAARTDVWLLNVDRSVLYAQECYWAPDASYHDLDTLTRDDWPSLFLALDAGAPITGDTDTEDDTLAGFRAGAEVVHAVGSLLVAPICRGPRAIGAIVVGQAGAARHWTQSEISFAGYLADLVIRMLEAHDRQVAEEGLRGFNEMLEARVKSRTRELSETLETLELAQDELVRSEKMASLGGLVAGVAHEINTPLGVALTSITHLAEAVKGFETLVASGKIKRTDLTDFMETSHEATSVIRRNLERAAHLVRSFKMVAVDQGMDDARDLDVSEYLGEIVDSLKPTLRKQGVVVVCADTERLMMRTVAGDLSHILTNLIMNAALHAFPDEAAPRERRVTISARMDGRQVVLEVADNGKGIPADIRGKIFEPFFTTARGQGGSGLGLNIVYNTIYQKMKGSIDVLDVDGGGTCFRIRLPVR